MRREEDLYANVYQATRVLSVTPAPQDTLACPHCTRVPLVTVLETSTLLTLRPATRLLENASNACTTLEGNSVQPVLMGSLAMPPFPTTVNVSWSCMCADVFAVQGPNSTFLLIIP